MPRFRLEDEYREPFDAWKADPTPQAAGNLLRTLNPVFNTAINAYAPQAKSPTLRSHAKSIALNALQSYDPQKASLRTHLMQNLQRLKRLGGQAGQIVRVPERIVLDRQKLDDATSQLVDELGRPPTDDELADYTGLPFKRIAKIRKAVRPMASGFFSDAEEADEGYAPAVVNLWDNVDPWLRFVYDDLTPRDRFIMERSLGMNGHRRMAPSQIAKALKITPSAISQRMAYIQSLLDRRQEVGLL